VAWLKIQHTAKNCGRYTSQMKQLHCILVCFSVTLCKQSSSI